MNTDKIYFNFLKNVSGSILVKQNEIIEIGNPLEIIANCARKGVSTNNATLYIDELNPVHFNYVKSAGINIKTAPNKILFVVHLDLYDSYGDLICSLIKTKRLIQNLGFETVVITIKEYSNASKFLLIVVDDDSVNELIEKTAMYDIEISKTKLSKKDIFIDNVIFDTKEIIDIDWE